MCYYFVKSAERKKYMLKAAGLILNRENSNAVRCAEKASEFLRQHGVQSFNPQQEDKGVRPDLIITFGGDSFNGMEA